VEILEREDGLKVDVKTGLSADELIDCISGYDGLIVRSKTKVTGEVIGAGKKLKVIGRAGVGVDNVDVPSATERGIIVMNAPAGNTISTAEHTVAMILALSRNVAQGVSSLKEGKWERKKFMGVELFGKVLGIVGLGRIGSEVAKRGVAFGMRVVGYDPYIPPENVGRIGVESVELKDLLARADYITVHVPLTSETKHFIGQKEFKQMKQDVRIVNCARGGIVDEKALYQAIKDGKVAGAAFDVFEEEPPVNSPLLKLDEVIATPHLGASTEEAQVGVAVDIANQMVDFFKKGIIRNAVNLPPVEPEIFEGLKPYFRLAEKLGSLESQLVEGRMKIARIVYSGEDLTGEVSVITPALLKGLFEPILKEAVNYVNAPVVARKRGVKVVESKSSQVEDYTNLMKVELETDKSKVEVAGTLFGKKDARIVSINGYRVDAIPEGYMLICSHEDKPGIVGQIGVVLGKASINIAGMTLGRKKRGGKEMTVLNVDAQVPEEVLRKIEKGQHILNVKQVRL
jgi:D-3-phosphoglycerate dehydrogenase